MLRRIKGKLPENIYFVLSSQYASVLTESVRLEVESDPRRHIKVMPFSQQEILEYLQNKGIESGGILDKVEQKSGGIPVYLHYISEILLKVDAKEYVSTLEALPLLADGEINTYHSYLYQTIQDDSLARWVLAVLAYRRENSSVETIQKLLELAGESKSLTEIEAVLMRFSHLLRQTDARTYSIFHNSFREFIISRTQDLRAAFHRALIRLYEKEPFSDEAYRNYFDHLLQSKEYCKILSLASVEWLKSAWNHFRPLQEIAYNLEIALDAAIAERSLPDFIRVAFLKAQADRATFNLESTSLDFPLLLLEAGETAASLRHIWDGDFVLTSKEYFCRYLEGYYKIHAAFPHQNLLRQGFAKPLSKSDAPHLILEWKTLAIVYGNVDELFAEIDATTWHTSDRMHRNYVRQANTQEKNADFNRQIKIKIVRHLARHKRYKELLLLSESSIVDPPLHQAVQIALIQVLLPLDSERAHTLERLKALDYEAMSYPKFCSLVVFCSNYLSDAQIREHIPSRSVILPALVGKVIEEGRGNYTLRKDILGLFDQLKVAYVFDSGAVQVFRVQASVTTGNSNRLYQSILELAELWHLQRQGRLDQSEILRRTDTSLAFLHLDLAPQLGLRSAGLFDMDNDDYFIARGMAPLVKDILRLAVNVLDETSLRNLILSWLDREKRNNAWSYHTLGITVAKSLYRRDKRLPDLERTVLAHAEHLAAADHDTLTLVSHLGEVSQAYGQGGYREDFQRLYNQLLDHAFGVGHRKDYQATNILEPLELIHESDPQGTLGRIAENLRIFNTLSDAGNSRMHHIALSSMIRFVAKDYLQLAFELMHREEAHIDRDDVLDSILPPRIQTSTAGELHLYWAIVKTLPRWNKRESNGFRSCSKYILQRAIHFDNNSLMEEVLETVKNNLIVELQEHSALKPFAQVLQENGKTCIDFGIPEPNSIEDEAATASPALEKLRNKFSLAVTELDFDELKKLLASDFKSFEQYIDSHYTALVQRDRNRYLREQYRQIRPLFETFIDNSAPHLAEVAKSNSTKLIRQFIIFKEGIVGLPIATPIDFRRFGEPLMSMARSIDTILGGDDFQPYLTDDFDTKRWFNQLKHGLRDDRDFTFSGILTDEQLFDLVAAVSLLKLEGMADFVNRYSRGRTRTAALLKISHRLAGIDPERAKAVVKQLSLDGYDDLLFKQDSDPLDLGFDIIETLFRIDVDFAKEFTLDSYRRQKGRYASDITGSIDKLIRYSKHFDTGHESIREYYEANLSYNRELAVGLPQKANTYDYVENHIENIGLSGVVIGHLKWLFNYPAMKIRHLSLQSAYDLLIKNPGLLPIFTEEVLEKGKDNETEYGLIVLMAVALKDPSILLSFKLQFMRVISREHLSIQEHLKELLLLIDRNHAGFLSTEEKTLVDRINTPSGLVYPPYSIVKSARGKAFLYSQFQAHLLETISELETGEVSVADLLYSDLVRNGWKDYAQADDSAIHRQYNRNTNFDTIEIQSPYYDQVKASLNTILAAMIKRNEIEASGIAGLKELLRVYDPGALLYSIVAKPNYVNWIPAGIDKKAFMAFSDLEGMMSSFADREIDMVTLYESGNQRSHEYKVLDGTTYFEIYAYLKKRKATLGESDPNPYRSFQNAYAHELPKYDLPIDSFPVKGVQPVLQVSYGVWRGENGVAYALPFPELLAKWGFNGTLSALLGSNGGGILQAMHWIGPYDFSSSDRRVYMPFSEGFTLRVDKKILREYLLANDLVLAYHVSIRRASDGYIAERAMRFKPFESDFEVDI